MKDKLPAFDFQKHFDSLQKANKKNINVFVNKTIIDPQDIKVLLQ